MGILNIFRRKRVDDGASQRSLLLRSGRITEGIVFDVIMNEAGDITQIFFRYNISGVDFEASQMLDAEQLVRQGDYSPGSRVVVRYHPQQPGNSTAV